MNRGALAVLAAGAFVGVSLLARRAADRAAEQSAASEEGDGSTAFDYANPWGLIERQFDAYQTDHAMSETNVAAFLSMIAYAEGTDRGADPYRVCYGYRHTIADLRDHPAVTGEWRGEKLPDVICAGAGMSPGCVSTAAGRYQLIRPTWLACKRALGLPDFAPDSQDRAAVYLIRQRGALDDVKAGRIADAIAKVAKEWASLPGANYGQPERPLAGLSDAFTDAGGVIA